MKGDRIVGAPAPVTFHDEKGNAFEYLMSPLQDRDIVELDNWVRMRYMQLVRESLRKDEHATEEEKEREIKIAQREMQAMTWMSGQGARIMGTVEGMVRMVWTSARKNHPELKPEHLQSLMLSERNILEANQAFALLNLGKAAKKSSKKGASPETTSHVRKSISG